MSCDDNVVISEASKIEESRRPTNLGRDFKGSGFEDHGWLRRLTTKMPFFSSISSSIGSFGLKGYCESKTMLEGIVIYSVFPPGFFSILPLALRTMSFPNDIHVSAM